MRWLVGLVLSILLLLGCASGPTLVGKWEDSSGGGTVTFNEDGTYRMDGQSGGLELSILGTYKVEEDKLSITQTELRGSSDQEKAGTKVNVPPKVTTIKWNGNDEVAMTPVGGGPTTVLRRKS